MDRYEVLSLPKRTVVAQTGFQDTTVEVTSLAPSHQYSFAVRAVDKAGNISALSDPVTVSTAVLPAKDTSPTAGPSVINEEWPSYGQSSFTYADLRDSAPKYEGGYASFDETATAKYKNDPHGGYATTSNKCKICHAVHRAEGAYELLRGDTQADACVYCHVGSGHSDTIVYDSNPRGVYTNSGHTIGASPVIPASANSESIETTVLASTDASGVVTTSTVVLRVAGEPNRMFRLRRTHTQSPAGVGRAGYQRIGPVSLTCMSCHTPHDAADELWQPMAYPDNATKLTKGYMLLRASPSGSVQGPDDMPYDTSKSPGGGPATVSYTSDGMKRYKAYTDYGTTGLVNSDNVVRVPETTLTAGVNYGPGKTIWDSPGFATVATGVADTPANDQSQVNQYTLSVWCADCHTLTIGQYDVPGRYEELGYSSHETSMTHDSPMEGAGNGPGQCYTCHRSGLSAEPTATAYAGADAQCQTCHYGTGSFATDPFRATVGGSDWPHSAEASSAYMLGAWTRDPRAAPSRPLR